MPWPDTHMILAQTDSLDIVLGCAALIVVLLAGAIGTFWMRRRIWGNEPPAGEGGGFTLSDLRQLHKQGQITTEEFERAKGMAVAAARRQADQMQPAKIPPASDKGPTAPPDR